MFTFACHRLRRISVHELPIANNGVNFRFDASHRVDDVLNTSLQDCSLEGFGDDIGCSEVKRALFSGDVGRR